MEVKTQTICPIPQNGKTDGKIKIGDAEPISITLDDLKKWPFEFPVRDLGELSDHSRNEAAYMIARRLIQVAEGNINDPATWERYAEGRGFYLDFISDIKQSPGRYVPPEQPEGPSGIRINLAYDQRSLARAWVHELAHDALWRWIPVQLRHGADAHSYDGDAQDVHHDIARRVERYIFGQSVNETMVFYFTGR